MKNHIIIKALLVGLLIFSSCSSSDDGVNTPDNSNPLEELLIGDWTLDGYQFQDEDGTINFDIPNNECNSNERHTYFANGNMVVVTYDDSIEGECNVGETFQGTWTLDGNILTWSISDFQGNEYEMEITATSLILRERLEDCENCISDYFVWLLSRAN